MSFWCVHVSRFTYEIAPVFVLMEQLTLKKMREIVGWPSGEGDGIFSPGLCTSSDPPPKKKIMTKWVKNVSSCSYSFNYFVRQYQRK